MSINPPPNSSRRNCNPLLRVGEPEPPQTETLFSLQEAKSMQELGGAERSTQEQADGSAATQ